jgi:hypothetical protein
VTPDLTQALAAYGAVVSTLSVTLSLGSLALSFRVARRDRAHAALRGNVASAHSVTPGRLIADLGECVQLTASNKGRRPMTITAAGWSLPNGRHFFSETLGPAGQNPRLVAPELPHRLDESETCTFRWPLEYFTKNPPVRFFVTDSHNTSHFMSWRRNRKLVKQINAALKKASKAS